MINPSDKGVNVFHKGWQRSPSGANPETGFEDPTYLGFRLILSSNSFPNYENRLNDNSLFTPKEELTEGAERYLESIGMTARAAMIKRFRETMISLTKRTPWFIQSVEGVAALWKIDKTEEGFDPYRGKELELTFNCLESIDLRMTAVADLYRKASFDAKYMREILPENLREFRCELQIAEIRKFHTVAKKVNQLSGPQNAENANHTNVQSGSHDDHGDKLEFLDEYISLISFDLRDCEFDFEDSFPDDTFGVAGDYSQATQKFKIRVGKVYKEKNQYTLLETILADDYSNGSSSIIKGDVRTDDLSIEEKNSQFLPHEKIDQSAAPTGKLDSSKKSELQRRLERGAQTLENRGRDELNRLQAEAKNLINEKVFDNKIADFIRGFLDEVRAGDLGETFAGNPAIEYKGVTGSEFEGNPPIEYPGTNGTVYDPGQPTYPGTSGTVHDPNNPTYPGTSGETFEGNPKITYPGTSGTSFEGNPEITYPGVKDKSFENPDITYPGVKDKSFENPAITYPGVKESSFENPEITYPKISEEVFDGNPDIKYEGVKEKTFDNPENVYPGIQDKSFEGNPNIKYEKPDGKIFEGGNETILPASLEKVFDTTGMTADQIRKMESLFSNKQEKKESEPLGDLFNNVPGKDLGVPERKYEKPEGKIFDKEEVKNTGQNLGSIFPNDSKTEE